MSLVAPHLHELIAALETEVAPAAPVEEKVRHTEDVLSRFLGTRLEFPPFVQASTDHYARYLVHRDPQDRFSVVAMVWGPQQKTAIHDHDGVWCVEGVYQGELDITQFDMRPLDGERLTMEPQKTVAAGPRAVGNLIPPFEYHSISNPHPHTAISVHVYGRELKSCRRYMPADDGFYRAAMISLRYDGDVGV
ncbi:MAG TPA: cysteine dioxygenase family protein [Candidatus Xenobia bacterium]|jgi:predicted metal-dependent enzyme (double-stranded beta helix superfamily)